MQHATLHMALYTICSSGMTLWLHLENYNFGIFWPLLQSRSPGRSGQLRDCARVLCHLSASPCKQPSSIGHELVKDRQIILSEAQCRCFPQSLCSVWYLTHHHTGCFFFTGPPPEKLKYEKLRLGEVTCI